MDQDPRTQDKNLKATRLWVQGCKAERDKKAKSVAFVICSSFYLKVVRIFLVKILLLVAGKVELL